MPKTRSPKSSYATRQKELTAHTDQFCTDLLNDEYRDMCRVMVKGLCVRGSPALEGDARLWAAAVVAALGKVNFLDDNSFQPYYSRMDLAKLLGYSYSRLKKYADILIDGFELSPFDLDFTLPSLMKHNPLVTLLASPSALLGNCCAAPARARLASREDCCQKPTQDNAAIKEEPRQKKSRRDNAAGSEAKNTRSKRTR